MKKITLLLVAIFLSLQVNAQIAAGSVAPNFTAVDINGVSHTLSDYLAAGKTVIMDVSATWCGPCWNYHNGKALEDIYTAYGVDGSNEVVVLFIEGDSSTTLANLNGIGAATQGNWVEGTPYPIIDGSNIGNLYQIAYFPTVFRICPNGLVYEIGQLSAPNIKTNINANCGLPALTGIQNHVEIFNNELGLCSPTGNAVVKVKNFAANVTGVTNIATVNLKENGTVVSTKATTGAFTQFATKSITFDPYEFNPAATYTYELANINGQPNHIPANSLANLSTSYSVPTTFDVVVKAYIDNWPTEASWRIKNSTGAVVASFGPYAAADANSTKIHNVTLPSENECYSVELVDSYGDGWGAGTTPHGLEIFNGTTSILNIVASSFQNLLAKQNALKTGPNLAITNNVKSNSKIFPNPSTGVINISSDVPVNIAVIDILGKTVFSANNISNDFSINLSSLQKGMYIAKITGENINYTEKLILN